MAKHPGARPRYREIEAAIRHDIESGRFAPGDDLPTESDLCEQYAVSRITIREALRHIEAAGYIERRQGRGSRVVSRWPRERFVLSATSLDALEQSMHETTLSLRRVSGPIPRALAHELAIDDAQDWIHYRGVRSLAETGQPVAAFDTYSRREYEVVESSVGYRGLVLKETVEKFGLRLAYVDQVMSVAPLPTQVARRLHLEPGQLGFRNLCMFVGETVGMFQFSLAFSPAETYAYHLRLTRWEFTQELPREDPEALRRT
jgi:GntR family transcriptional regulator